MNRLPVPIANINRRLPEAGRIRIGVKSGRAMKALREFRFTSHDEQALEQVAALYGGDVRPWSEPKAAPGQFELLTDATEIRVVLPPDPLTGTPIYERWTGGGCDRRCDGETCTTQVQGPDGPEPSEVDCLCVAAGEMSCDVKVRLNVLLPEVRFIGTWRLESKSWNAAQELPGMVDLIQELMGQGLTHASLTLQPRKSVRGGQTHNFVIPVLGIPASLEQLAAGASRLQSLGAGVPVDAPALGAGSSGGDDASPLPPSTASEVVPPDAPPDISPSAAGDLDDEIADAEIVDDSIPPGSSDTSPADGDTAPPSAGPDSTGQPSQAQMKRLMAGLRSAKVTGPQRHTWASGLLGREVTSFSELSARDCGHLIDCLDSAS